MIGGGGATWARWAATSGWQNLPCGRQILLQRHRHSHPGREKGKVLVGGDFSRGSIDIQEDTRVDRERGSVPLAPSPDIHLYLHEPV